VTVETTAASERIRRFFDDLGDEEWQRLEKDLPGRVSLEVHRRFLARFVRPDMRVLEVGAGPGRFTIELARLGARGFVTDLSAVQLGLNAEYVRAAGAEHAVDGRELLDITRDLDRFDDGSFDAVLAYGGPLSYTFEHADSALRGLLRVAGRSGVLVASVMSLLGAWRDRLAGAVELATQLGEDSSDAMLRTGDLRHLQREGHVCQLFRAAELHELVARCGGTVLATSASNWASLGDQAAVATLAADPDRWRRFLDHEVRACAEPGALDGGTHILVAATGS